MWMSLYVWSISLLTIGAPGRWHCPLRSPLLLRPTGCRRCRSGRCPARLLWQEHHWICSSSELCRDMTTPITTEILGGKLHLCWVQERRSCGAKKRQIISAATHHHQLHPQNNYCCSQKSQKLIQITGLDCDEQRLRTSRKHVNKQYSESFSQTKTQQ